METLISMLLCNSRGSSNSRIRDSSTYSPPIPPPNTTASSPMLNPVQTLRHTSRRMETYLTGAPSRLTEGLPEEGSRQQTMLTQEQLTQAIRTRLLM
uniref:C4 protein n=1 Tax=Begomovirus alternantherae TaxID=337826 RepID=A0A0B7JMA9_9GEMI|nr:C4 protein [Alternanthera yellow vein virus]AWK29731.1 C4 protein [Alternanthera yellow vein virus]CEO43661.1 AC4 protein [Alternanthera yellow vein virus]